jgi:hypothetical protein
VPEERSHLIDRRLYPEWSRRRPAHTGAPAKLSTDVREAQKAERLRLALSTLLSTCSGKTPEFNQVRFQTELLQAIPPFLEEPLCISPHAVAIFPVGVPLGNDLVEWVVVCRSQSVARNQPKILRSGSEGELPEMFMTYTPFV